MKRQPINLETLMDGELSERVNEALMDAVVNMMDPNTDTKKKRRVIITIDLLPDDDRRVAGVSASVTTKLAPPTPAKTYLAMGVSERGEIEVAEYDGQIRGQMSLADFEDEGQQEARGFDAATGEIFEGNVASIGQRAARKAGGAR